MSRPPRTTLQVGQNCLWTEDALRILLDGWEAGDTTQEIADKIPGATKSAVIGKAHRIGLDRRPSPIKVRTATDEQILSELRSGRGANEIGKRLHVDARTVRKLRDEHGLTEGRTEFVPMIKDSYQITFDLIVIERPKPMPVLPAWRSMPIPPAKTCQWCEEGPRPRTWIFCDDPNVVPGRSYCGPHYERSIEPALEAVA